MYTGCLCSRFVHGIRAGSDSYILVNMESGRRIMEQKKYIAVYLVAAVILAAAVPAAIKKTAKETAVTEGAIADDRPCVVLDAGHGGGK